MPKPTARELIDKTPEFTLSTKYDAVAHPPIPFNPKRIIHVRLSLDTPVINGLTVLKFKSYPQEYKIPAGDPFAAVEKFARDLEDTCDGVDLSAGGIKSLWKGLTPAINPYDITLTEPYVRGEQGFVVLQLDPCINWCFTRGEWGVTTKDFYSDDNFGVQFVDIDGVRSDGSLRAPLQRPSRILYFAFARRTHDTKQSFNFHIEFFWDGEVMNPDGTTSMKEHKIPMIFDPDIPSAGGGSIP